MHDVCIARAHFRPVSSELAVHVGIKSVEVCSQHEQYDMSLMQVWMLLVPFFFLLWWDGVFGGSSETFPFTLRMKASAVVSRQQ